MRLCHIASLWVVHHLDFEGDSRCEIEIDLGRCVVVEVDPIDLDKALYVVVGIDLDHFVVVGAGFDIVEALLIHFEWIEIDHLRIALE